MPSGQDVQSFVSSPWVGIGLGILFLVIQQKMSPITSNWALVIAWGFFLWAIFQTPPVVRQPIVARGLWTLMFGSVVGLVLYYTLWTAGPINVFPKRPFVLHSGQWANHTNVAITNIGSTQLYSIFVKIWTENSGIASEDIAVEPTEDNPHAPIVDLDVGGRTVQIRSDVLMANFVDSQQHEAVLIRFYTLAPHESRHLTVSGTKAVAGSARVKALAFNPAPDRVVTQKGKVAFIMRAPESGRIKTVRFKTGKVGP